MNRLLEHPSLAPYEPLVGRVALREAVNAQLDRARALATGMPFEAILAGVLERVDAAAARTLRGAINATGTLLHTNLGRAPLASRAFEEARAVALGYSNLEYDLVAGERGSRYDHATDLLRELTGAQDALVVNNCAAAIFLVLDTFARGAEAVVGRNSLIEIGGGFRLPDVLARSGAQLVEAGTTNKVYIGDFERALSPRTALIVRSHRSNFSLEGFTHDVEPSALAALARRAGVASLEDLGSGALVDLGDYGLPHERTVQEAVADGFSLVAFSGDKLLGGPQAGIIVGSRAHVARLRANPLVRALRVDKVTLALLRATLDVYRRGEERDHIPFWQMLAAPLEALRARAQAIAQVFAARAVESDARIGGGALPQARIPSAAVALGGGNCEYLAARLRHAPEPVIGRIENGELLLDMRTVPANEDQRLLELLRRALA